MRIGIDISVLNEKNRTGVGVYAYELIKNYLDIDKKNQIILFGFATFKTARYLESLFKSRNNIQIKIIKMPAKIFKTLFLLWQKINFPKIENLIGDVDIYHSFNWYLPPQARGKAVATIFDITSIKYPEFHQSTTIELDKLRFERIKENADLVIAISESAKQDFSKRFKKSNVEVIYPSTQEIFNQKLKLDKKIFKKYEIENDYILAVGTLEPRKNLISLIKAYLEIKTDKKLVLAGNMGWKNDGINNLINLNKDKIISTGFVNDKDLYQLYKNAFCFVYPSFYEGFGIPVLSALKLGVPVITSNTSSLPEVGGKAVLYIDPNNYKTIKNALKKLLKDKALVNKLKQKGKAQAKLFSYKKSARKLKRIYESLDTSSKIPFKIIHKRK